MSSKRVLSFFRNSPARPSALGWIFAGALALTSALACAQDAAPSPGQKPDDGFFASVGRWFSQQSANVNSSFKDARQKVEGLGQEAGAAAKSTVEGAKDA